ncbi:hypothetical protein RCL1_001340 [Eukaryota sp. TZLM3-RCL]
MATLESLQEILDFVLNHRRSQERTQHLQLLVSTVSKTFIPQVFDDRLFSLAQLVSREIKAESSDVFLLLKLHQIVSISLFTDAEEFVKQTLPELQWLALRNPSGPWSYSAFQCIAVGLAYAIEDEDVNINVLQWVSKFPPLINFPNDGPILVFSSLAITVPESCVYAIEPLCRDLHRYNVNLQFAASTFIGILAEHLISQHRSELIPLICVESINEMLADPNRRIPKEDRLTKKRHLMSVLETIQSHSSPSESIVVEGSSLNLTSWSQLFTYLLLKNVYEGTTHHHLAFNDVLRDAFGLPPRSISLAEKLDVAEVSKKTKVAQRKEVVKEKKTQRRKDRSKKVHDEDFD